MSKIAVIFDMDGVITDNNAYHEKAWQIFCKKYELPIFTHEVFMTQVVGKTNSEILVKLFENLTSEQKEAYSYEKESIYRDIYRADAVATEGLITLLQSFQQEGIKCGLATNAPVENMDFTLDVLNIRSYFTATIYAKQVARGKPFPDIYLKMAEMLQTAPQNCIVFEDSLTGISAALAANMTVVGVTSTYPPEVMKGAKATTKDFTSITVDYLKELLR
jgi:HAD superfamily hydrolase (TIGR01509 family)